MHVNIEWRGLHLSAEGRMSEPSTVLRLRNGNMLSDSYFEPETVSILEGNARIDASDFLLEGGYFFKDGDSFVSGLGELLDALNAAAHEEPHECSD